VRPAAGGCGWEHLYNNSMKIKTDWNFVATLCCIGLFGILLCGMARWIDVQAQRIDTLELEMISLKGPATVKKAEVYWHGKMY
jgi:hypothetical protein